MRAAAAVRQLQQVPLTQRLPPRCDRLVPLHCCQLGQPRSKARRLQVGLRPGRALRLLRKAGGPLSKINSIQDATDAA